MTDEYKEFLKSINMTPEQYHAKKEQYVRDCLAKEECRPVGMYGHMSYYLFKSREFKEFCKKNYTSI